jgi:SEC-C motif domain protein
LLENNLCPCGSGSSYKECCQPYHQGIKKPLDALALMRSRYSAYFLHLPDYIIETTHPKNKDFTLDKEGWKKEILDFCLSTYFYALEILEFKSKEEEATVTFIVRLSQNGIDNSFCEESHFQKESSRWLYKSGKIRKIL